MDNTNTANTPPDFTQNNPQQDAGKESRNGAVHIKNPDIKQPAEMFDEVAKSEVKRSKKEGFFKRNLTK